ncbi:hypothetical protein BCR44DRAFT_31243 [Catenaria anguillulae PL171]|uniref:Transmembrane protein n=1 Tax=Catenaria anguillulae PL171 TaxID=765915 RepID=A0A1Y2HBW9_9FUNG|nr:hypothetical protein BCR44DRAFT_31243 [Catenaria anguillulae PL171]
MTDMKRKSVLIIESGTPGSHVGSGIGVSPSPSFYRSSQPGSTTNLAEGTLSLSRLKSTLKTARQHTLPRADKEFYRQASKVLVSIAVMVVSALSASLSFVLIFSILGTPPCG